ncbi:MAG: transposase [Lachnospiraceae bacterium]|nr:transposase [Lachnospiraceae bacterium]
MAYYNEEQNGEFAFLTNDFSLPALVVAELYRNRWSVELFFK